MWLRSLASTPGRPASDAATGLLLAHIQGSRMSVACGAGSAVAAAAFRSSQVSVKKARRWLLGHCRAGGAASSADEVMRACLSALGPFPEAARHAAERKVRDAVEVLRHEGLLHF
jgi:hypothetical protein